MKNGNIWPDTDGNPIHAHGGYIIKHGDFFYWYGEDRRGGSYVSCYRSCDLENWEFRNIILQVDSKCEKIRVCTDLSLSHENKEGCRMKVNIERPKVLYCEATGKFVMWAHYENGIDYHDARCAIASCEMPDGDFTYHGSFAPYGYMSRDCTLYNDDINGDAYFVSASRDNADIHVYRLASDYLNVDALTNVLWQGEYREAPALFRRGDKYFMISSFCTGWKPNQGKCGISDSIGGRWSILREIGDATTYLSQSAFVLPVVTESGTKYYYWGDRWEGGGENYIKSTYVVLEIKFDANGMPRLDYTDETKFELCIS